MLQTAFENSSESVIVDLLTYQDLDLLKAKKNPAKQQQAIAEKLLSKRYLILTYKVEFDKVHYPLPLSFEEEPDTDTLQKQIQRLRKQLDNEKKTTSSIMQSSASRSSTASKRIGAVEFDRMHTEKQELVADIERYKEDINKKIKQLQKQNEQIKEQILNQKQELSKAITELEHRENTEEDKSKTIKRQIDRTEEDKELINTKIEKLQIKYEAEIGTLQDEMEILRQNDKKQKQKIRQLEQDLNEVLQKNSRQQRRASPGVNRNFSTRNNISSPLTRSPQTRNSHLRYSPNRSNPQQKSPVRKVSRESEIRNRSRTKNI